MSGDEPTEEGIAATSCITRDCQTSPGSGAYLCMDFSDGTLTCKSKAWITTNRLRCQALVRSILAAFAIVICLSCDSPEIDTSESDSSNWVTYSGDYDGQRHSDLNQITPNNVNRLTVEWTFQTGLSGSAGRLEASPIAADGILYITGPGNYGWAISVMDGRQLWEYRRQLPPDVKHCCGPVNRGFGRLYNKLFMATIDAHLVSLDANTGDVLYDVVLADYRLGYSATVAPLVVKDKVLVGIAGGEYPIRGFIDAYDARSGTRAWRFYTVPAVGEAGADTWANIDTGAHGGAVWVTGTYDPDSNLTYWGVGNPNPDFYGGDRAGDNLYTNCLIALDIDTGRLAWFYQFTPHDVHDWDSAHVPVLADIDVAGAARKVVMVANRNGFFYVLDRTTGQLLLAKSFIKTNWASEIGPDGRPIVITETGTSERCLPDPRGGTLSMPPSYDPQRRLFFVTARESCAVYFPERELFRSGQLSMGGSVKRLSRPWSALRAIDPITVGRRWEHPYATESLAGILSTSSGLVFTGDDRGHVIAVDSSTGQQLWSHPMGGSIHGTAPITYMLNGRQHIVIVSGTTVSAFALSPHE